jgi:hypothetical protein
MGGISITKPAWAAGRPAMQDHKVHHAVRVVEMSIWGNLFKAPTSSGEALSDSR